MYRDNRTANIREQGRDVCIKQFSIHPLHSFFTIKNYFIVLFQPTRSEKCFVTFTFIFYTTSALSVIQQVENPYYGQTKFYNFIHKPASVAFCEQYLENGLWIWKG